jgi:cytochrome P450
MTKVADVSIPPAGFTAASPAVQRDPYPYYHWLLRNDPVHRGADGLWYVSRYADVRSVLSDQRFGRAGIRDYWISLVGPGPLSQILRHTLFFRDPPDHDRLRALLAPAFTPRSLRAMEPMIDEVVDDLLAPALRDGGMDVVNDFAYPLALTVIARLLGIPAEDRARLRAWTMGFAPSSVQSNSRMLSEDVEVHGRALRRGDVVVGLIGAANRDPARFTDPDRFDVERADVQPMSFGACMRFCLGAMLARMEARAAFGRLVALPGIHLTVAADDLTYHRSTMFRGVTRLPVAFRAA